MSAEDNLSKQQFYHGSNHPFKEGDIVKPHDNFAWASTVPDVAAGYGSTTYKVEPLGEVKRVPGAAKEFGIHTSTTGFKVTGVHK
jgi:hypothetical protein